MRLIKSKRILKFVVAILLLVVITSAGFLDYYGIIEANITVLPPQYVVKYFHPTSGVDTTCQPMNYLTDSDLQKLKSSDDDRYKNCGQWKQNFRDSDFIEFNFTFDIPSNADILEVNLTFEWQRTEKISNARLQIWNGTWQNYTLSLPSPGVDGTEIIDLFNLYKIDTPEKLNSFRIRFQRDGSGQAFTYHDFVEVKVKYVEK